MFKSEKGQSLTEYALILILVAIVVIVLIGACWWLIAAALIIPNWAAITAWGANLVAGVMAGDPKWIFIAIVITVVVLFLIFGRRR